MHNFKINQFDNNEEAESTMAAEGGLSRVFVYGTLKKGFYNHQFLSAASLARFVGGATCAERLHMAVGGPNMIPFMQDPAGAKTCLVRGEVYEVDNPTLAELDRIEGVPHHYHRRETLVKIHSCPQAAETSSSTSTLTSINEKSGMAAKTSTVDSQDCEQTTSCFIYIKTEPAQDLLQMEPLEEYTLRLHHAYVPPPLRPGQRKETHESDLKQLDFSHCYSAESEPWKAFMNRLMSRTTHVSANSTDQRMKVLEMGCGPHAPVRAALSSLTYDVTSSDVSATTLEKAAAAFGVEKEDELERAGFVHANLAEIFTKFPYKSFDAVVCLGVLHSVSVDLHFHCLRILISLCRGGGPILVNWPSEFEGNFARFLRDLQIESHPSSTQDAVLLFGR